MCEYCDHETNEEAKRFPLFNENAKREEAFIDEDNKQIRHQKYKRCLAMAKLCRSEWAASIFIPEKGGTDKQAALYMKWEKRWLAIANKFKDKEA